MKEAFKLDSIELVHAAETGLIVHGSKWVAASSGIEASLARQLHAAGAPDAPLEEQLRTLLASHLAMQQAGDVLPGVAEIHSTLGLLDEHDAYVAEKAYDLFLPIVARLTQRATQGEWLAEQRRKDLAELARQVEAHSRCTVAAESRAKALEADVERLTRERDEARVEREDAYDILDRLAARFEVSRAELPQAAEYAQAYAQEVEAERAALRQRAERAERERDDLRIAISRDLEESLDTLERLRRDLGAEEDETPFDATERIMQEFGEIRARIAELEASREPGAVVRHCPHGHVVGQEVCPYGNCSASSPQFEPGADVVERLQEVYKIAAYEDCGDAKGANAAGIRAVLTHLAAMGEEAWLTVEDAERALDDHMGDDDRPDCDVERMMIKAILQSCRSRLSPVLGAFRARVAELEAGLRETTAEFQDALVYVDDHFREKWGYDATVEKAKALGGEVKS